MSAMTHIKPDGLFDHNGMRTGRACNSGAEDCQWKSATKARDIFKKYNVTDGMVFADAWYFFQKSRFLDWKFSQVEANKPVFDGSANFVLNMGLIAGTKQNLISFIDAMNIMDYEDDQAVATSLFFNRPELFVIDYSGQVFGNNNWQTSDGCKYTWSSSGRLAHRETGIKPLFTHNPGIRTNPSQVDCLVKSAKLLGYA